MKICYFITVCNEHDELKRLLTQLSKHLDVYKHELFILMDSDSVSLQVKDLVDEFKLTFDYLDPTHNITVAFHSLNNDFATHKNYVFDKTNADYIFSIDADEQLSLDLAKHLELVLDLNDSVDLWWVPRKNQVIGITPEYAKSRGWNLIGGDWLEGNDFQGRIYRNLPYIRWSGVVHERIVGANRSEVLPSKMYLEHIKTIDKQIAQNIRYDKMI